MYVIPAIDIINSRCVRLRQGDYQQVTTYSEDPLALAKEFEQAGFHHLHVVDLDGAKAGHPVNHHLIGEIARQTNLIIDVGGGLKRAEDFATLFQAGVAAATIGSLAVEDPHLSRQLLAEWGHERLILGADSRNRQIAVSGWQETKELNIFEFVSSYLEAGFRRVIATDIAKDGMLSGPALELYRQLLTQEPSLELIASGGVTTIEDLEALRSLNCQGAIVGKALLDGLLDAKEVVAWMNN